jgi:predicted RNase H-like HicB family nuclease
MPTDAVRLYIETLQSRGLPIPEDTEISMEEVAVTA